MLMFVIVFAIGWGFIAVVFLASLNLLLKRSFRLRWRPLTHLIGIFEVVATGFLVNFYLSEPIIMREKVSGIAILIGGWFAIKSFNHPLSSIDEGQTNTSEYPLTQAELKYKFILGTLFSLGGGIFLGVMLYHFL